MGKPAADKHSSMEWLYWVVLPQPGPEHQFWRFSHLICEGNRGLYQGRTHLSGAHRLEARHRPATRNGQLGWDPFFLVSAEMSIVNVDPMRFLVWELTISFSDGHILSLEMEK